MYMTGEIQIHKSDAVTRSAKAIRVYNDGTLAVWDTVPNDKYGFASIAHGVPIKLVDMRTEEIIEPDVIVGSDKWERIERNNHSWKNTTINSMMQEAEKREDVDEDEVKDNM